MSENMDRLKNLLSIIWQMSSLDPTITPKWQQDEQNSLASPGDILSGYMNLGNSNIGYAAPSGGGSMAPSSLRGVLRRAASAIGVPTSWADSPALSNILSHESSFNPRAKNPHSTAFGLFQFLGSTAKNYGLPYGTTDPYAQSVAGLKYIRDRYGNPDAAWSFWQKHRWY